MSKKEDARYDFSLCDVLITPLNDDLTQPTTTNIIGGVGPFDFSGVADDTQVPFISKIDTTAAETVLVDVSGAADTSAVTVAELFAAINLATPTDLTASAEAVTGRLKIAYSGAGSPSRVQVYGEAATLGMIGQGKGVRIVYSNTMQSFSDTPNLKDEETFTTTDAKGVDTEVISDGYRKGTGGTLTDTAMDYLLRSIVEGGVYDETAETYSAPTSMTDKIYFKIELYSGQYEVGTNKVGDLVGYIKTEIFSCKGTFGDRTRERGFVNSVYNYTATSPRDSSGNLTADSVETKLTVSEYEALSLENIAA